MKMALNKNKSPEDVLQERAAVLGRAGDCVSRALEKLQSIENRLQELLLRLGDLERQIMQDRTDGGPLEAMRRQMTLDVNHEISKYNRAREYAMMRYYYLIVTREAMGMRRHYWVEKHYRVPPRKKHLQDG
jgi:hypothetical protein